MNESLTEGMQRMEKPLVAHQNMQEFDPECEKHFPLLVVKAVDPGCTIELQIENGITGKVTRLSSTESIDRDRDAFEKALLSAFRNAWSHFTHRAPDQLTDRPKAT